MLNLFQHLQNRKQILKQVQQDEGDEEDKCSNLQCWLKLVRQNSNCFNYTSSIILAPLSLSAMGSSLSPNFPLAKSLAKSTNTL